MPKDAADLKRVLLQLNRPNEGRYATASYQGQAFFMDRFYSALFGAPNNWKLEGSKLTKSYETPEYREAIAFVRDLYVSGVFHPNTLNYADINAARLDFVAGQFVLYPEGFGQNWQDFWRRGLRNSTPSTFMPLPPFPAHQGGTAQHFMGPGFIATNALKRAPEARIRELLRIMDFLASPFGSQEDVLLQYGLEGVDWTADSGGKIQLNERSNVDANYVNWKYLIQHPGDVRAGRPRLRERRVHGRACAPAGRRNRPDVGALLPDAGQQGTDPQSDGGRRRDRHRRRPTSTQ